MNRSSDMHGESGATLLSVLLIIVLMSTAALAATDALARSVSVSRVSAARADSFWAVRGALSAGEVLVNEMMAASSGALDADAELFRDPVIFSYARGEISVRFKEASNCLNLNALALGDEAQAGGTVAPGDLHRMIEGAGLFNSEARQLVDTLSDWMDSDTSQRPFGAENAVYGGRDVPHRAPGQRLVSIQDLPAIEGFTHDRIERLAGLVCVRSDVSSPPLNINTLTADQAPLLAARFSSQLSIREAERLILSRPEGGWLNVDEFLTARDVITIAPELRRESALSVRSSRIAAAIAVSSDNGILHIDAIYARATDGSYYLESSYRRAG